LSAVLPQRVLVIYAHPESQRSRVNRRLLDAARITPGVVVHDLYATYPDFYIDVKHEQALIAEADLLVFVHPVRWYAMPSLLKEWTDTVFEAGWAYGKGATALRGKGYLLAVTTGGAESAYDPNGIHGRAFCEFLPPYEQTARLCGMHWQEPIVLHGAHHAGDDAVAAHVRRFIERISTPFAKESP
jgi:glutathione-regulated potassium-efflux system ancillary protein KefF